MADFRFACPHCKQRISGDSGYKGLQITCPSCQQSITVPDLKPKNPIATRIEHPPDAPPEPKTSLLAMVSLASSLALGIGCIPGIICGHLAWARLRRDPALKGKGMAAAGMIGGYLFLLGTIAFLTVGFLAIKPPQGHQLSAKESAAKKPEALAPRRVDEIKLGDVVSETAHNMIARPNVSATMTGRTFRETRAGGAFSYVMKVEPDRPMSLFCTYWGNDGTDNGTHPARRFEIFVNDKVVATQILNYNDPGHFFDVEYQIPAALTKGKTNVTVLFQARPGMWTGRLFGLQMLKR